MLIATALPAPSGDGEGKALAGCVESGPGEAPDGPDDTEEISLGDPKLPLRKESAPSRRVERLSCELFAEAFERRDGNDGRAAREGATDRLDEYRSLEDERVRELEQVVVVLRPAVRIPELHNGLELFCHGGVGCIRPHAGHRHTEESSRDDLHLGRIDCISDPDIHLVAKADLCEVRVELRAQTENRRAGANRLYRDRAMLEGV